MANSPQKIKKDKSLKSGYNYSFYVWYNFHYSFFRTLIKRGLIIKAFNRFILIKEGLKQKEKEDPYIIFLTAMVKIAPSVFVKLLQGRGKKKGIPLPISDRKRFTFGARWSIKLLKQKSHNIKISNIVDLLVSSVYSKGVAVDKKRELHYLASSNRTFLFNRYMLRKRKIRVYRF